MDLLWAQGKGFVECHKAKKKYYVTPRQAFWAGLFIGGLPALALIVLVAVVLGAF